MLTVVQQLTLGRFAMVVSGCVVLGIGVALLLTADLGSDGFSTLVNGLARATGIDFVWANVVVSLGFLMLAAVRGLLPGPGTVVQIAVVGLTADLGLRVLETPDSLLLQVLMLLTALPVLAVGIATYLGTHLGAGPAEAAALAWDPPVPFKWSYTAVQVIGGLVGWLCGADVGVGTLLVVLMIGPVVSRLLPPFSRLAGQRGP